MGNNSLKNKLKLNNPFVATAGVLMILIIVLAIMSPSFFTMANIMNVLQQITVNSIIALGMTMVILTGGIDLSVGSVVALSGIVMAKFCVDIGVNSFVSMFIGILIGIVVGLINGILIAKFKLQPMIATLGTMMIARGIALTIAQGRSISGFPDAFRWIGNARIPGLMIPVQVILMLLLYVIMFYVLRYRKVGRYIYAIGGNEEATRLSGINVDKNKIFAYILNGLFAAIAGIVMVSKLNSAVGTAGEGYEMDAVAASVIGGISLAGGRGSVWGTIIGAVILGIIKNGLNLLNVTTYIQQAVTGLIILIAVIADSFRSNALKKN